MIFQLLQYIKIHVATCNMLVKVSIKIYTTWNLLSVLIWQAGQSPKTRQKTRSAITYYLQVTTSGYSKFYN